MHERNKWAFWTVVAAGLVLVCIPSGILLDAVNRYETFLTGFEPSPLKPVKMRGTPHRGGEDAEPESKLVFTDFKLRSPKAKKVFLVGDFNHWKEGTLPLARMKDGSWELTMPLPKGKYHYRFVVDGQETLDPNDNGRAVSNGRPCSIKEAR